MLRAQNKQLTWPVATFFHSLPSLLTPPRSSFSPFRKFSSFSSQPHSHTYSTVLKQVIFIRQHVPSYLITRHGAGRIRTSCPRKAITTRTNRHQLPQVAMGQRHGHVRPRALSLLACPNIAIRLTLKTKTAMLQDTGVLLTMLENLARLVLYQVEGRIHKLSRANSNDEQSSKV
ncbi:hypothetical protein BU25DRAFT_419758 [Macroventuria anomochaeta]|uniref:Uncharacterized protein n=1 Tax=Macroventuria anomochaeta TaxID=301207 RepID=A0ACB6S7L7_9PLEO|nr:uncharacterized protein BU25DRAFT_419758 [Macroventuria anomochaeta]KAF2630131.1 hypothetical protein BU25DRAFT_419758 [Macroventuria anomochaeta]